MTPTATITQGEALKLLTAMAAETVDAVITDPPYSSGGMFRGDRAQPTAAKYQQHGQAMKRVDFSGDSRDQRSWHHWCALWLSECYRVLRPKGYVLMFADWRQLPTATDAVQAAGFIWRGVIAWDKGLAARAPHTGYFRHQCEYVIWGTKGACGAADGRGPWPGCFAVPVLQSDKHHMTGKPTKLMRELCKVVPEGSTILDPFSGSGTTVLAALQMGRHGIGFELVPELATVANKRIESWRAAHPLLA